MTTNSHQPRKYDVVISNDSNALANDAVLGGLERIKQLVAHGKIEQKIDALIDAFEYGNAGLDLIIQALQNSEVDVTEAAYWLLQESTEPKAKLALQTYNPYLFFEYLFTIIKQVIEGEEYSGSTTVQGFLAQMSANLLADEAGLSNSVQINTMIIPENTIGHNSLAEKATIKTDICEVSPTQISSFQIGIPKIGPSQISSPETNINEGSFAQVRFYQDSIIQPSALQIHTAQVSPTQIRSI